VIERLSSFFSFAIISRCALTAYAEGISTFYFSRIENDKISLGFEGYKKLAILIFNTAIHFGDCVCKVSDGKQFEFKGAWHGKSIYDWQHDIIEREQIA